MKPADDGLLTCRFCGELVRRGKKRRKKTICPVCQSEVEEPPALPTTPVSPVQPIAEPLIAGTHEDDFEPYPMSGARRYRCPGCNHDIEPDAIVCVACGLNLKTGQKTERTYQLLRRRWVNGFSFAWRMGLFLVSQAWFLAIQIHAWIELGEPPLLGGWLGFALLTAFLLGTYDQIDLVRNRRGLAKLTKTWRVCFVPRPPYTIAPEEYTGVFTNSEFESRFFDWLMFGILFASGVIPGLLWLYFHLGQPVYVVTITNQLGSSRILYRGRSQAIMNDIAEALGKVGSKVS